MEGIRVAALIPAAGEGVRLGKGPKAFVEVGGKTLLERSVTAFFGQVNDIIVAVSKDMEARANTNLQGQAKVIIGADTRQGSVWNLLEATAAELVLIHDAARPFLSAALIHQVIAATKKDGATTVATSVSDTLLELHTNQIIDRQGLRAVQTPQGFRRELILAAHRQAQITGRSATDDADLVRMLGKPVSLVKGTSWLMKITTSADLEMAEALAKVWDARA